MTASENEHCPFPFPLTTYAKDPDATVRSSTRTLAPLVDERVVPSAAVSDRLSEGHLLKLSWASAGPAPNMIEKLREVLFLLSALLNVVVIAGELGLGDGAGLGEGDVDGLGEGDGLWDGEGLGLGPGVRLGDGDGGGADVPRARRAL